MKNKDVLIIDDMIHTGTKLTESIKLIRQMGGKNIYAYITHNLLNIQSFGKIEKLSIQELITTNTIANVFSIIKLL